uniref:Bestrophin homolog n=1 Tax=Plectus sambesii TaxID=2011161 RepID=A0A914ULZ0_9BILA
IDLYVPVVTIVQFTFYIGWMKVAEALVNPFGEDDDDFEVNWLLDRNLQVGLQIVDNVASEKRPPLEKDFFWEDQYPEPLYSEEAAHAHVHPQVGSATEMPFHIDHDITMVHRVHEEGEDEPPMTPRSARSQRPQVVVRCLSTSSNQENEKHTTNEGIFHKHFHLNSTQGEKISGNTTVPSSLDVNNVENGHVLATSSTRRASHVSSNASVLNELLAEKLNEGFTVDMDDDLSSPNEKKHNNQPHFKWA